MHTVSGLRKPTEDLLLEPFPLPATPNLEIQLDLCDYLVHYSTTLHLLGTGNTITSSFGKTIMPAAAIVI